MGIPKNETKGVNCQHSDELLQTLNSINADRFTDDGERSQTLLAAYALVSRLETPWDFVLRLCMGQVMLLTLTRKIGHVTDGCISQRLEQL